MRVQLRHHNRLIADSVRIVPSAIKASTNDSSPVRGSYMLTRDHLIEANYALKAGDYQLVLADGAHLDITLCEVREHDGYLSGTFATRSREGRMLLQRPLLAQLAGTESALAA